MAKNGVPEDKQHTDVGLCKIAFKAPVFWEEDVTLWFSQIESMFLTAGITVECTKFHSVVASLSPNILKCAREAILNPTKGEEYTNLKRKLIDYFEQSEGSRLRNLLHELQLGDKRPSQLLNEMENANEGQLNNKALTTLWLERLPVHVQQILGVCLDDQTSLQKLAKIADKVCEAKSSTNNEISETTVNQETIDAMRSDIKELKTAITTPLGLYEYKKMPYGLRNAGSTFQRYLDNVLRDLEFCISYLDDIFIFSANEEEHKKHLQILLARLHEYGLVANKKKCVFGAKEIEFLGFLISENGISPLPQKIKYLREYKQPTDVKELRTFLAILNFYHRFLEGAAKYQSCLYSLVGGKKKNDKSPINWSEETNTAFLKCKEAITAAALLAFPVANAKLVLLTDASEVATGAALHQQTDKGLQPLGFFSRKLNKAQTRYSTYDRELLGIYLAVKHFRYMLEGREVVILTDHKPITFAFRQKTENQSPRQSRHLELISQFSTDIRHISGSENIVADALSRISEIELSGSINFEKMALEQSKDKELEQIKANPANTGLELKLMSLPNCDSQLYCDTSRSLIRPYVPEGMRRLVFDKTHQLSHPGNKATLKLLQSRFVWPNIKKQVAGWCRNCLTCQKTKVGRHTRSPLQQFPLPKDRFKHVHIDIVGPLPPSNGFRFVMTCIDRYTRWPEAIPIVDQTANTVAKIFISNWVSRFGVPEILTTDRGSNFESNLFREISKVLGVRRIHTTAYHAQANGIVERLHRSLKAAIMAIDPYNWSDALPLILLSLRSTIREDINASTAELVYGTTLCLPGELLQKPKSTSTATSEFVKQIRNHMKELRPVPTSDHSKNKYFVSKELSSCNYVFLRTDMVKKALVPPYQGPYQVLVRTSKTFTLLVKGKELVVSIDRVIPAHMPGDLFTESTTVTPSIDQRLNTLPAGNVTRSGRLVKRVVRFADGL